MLHEQSVGREINALSKTLKKDILTVLCVNTSSSDFIQNHVLGTSWKAALHTAKYITFILTSESKVNYSVVLRESESSYGGRNWQRAASGSLHVWAQGLEQAW